MSDLRSERRTVSQSISTDGLRRTLQNVVLRVRRVKVDSGHEEHTHLTPL
jgi:hypothetical protein